MPTISQVAECACTLLKSEFMRACCVLSLICEQEKRQTPWGIHGGMRAL